MEYISIAKARKNKKEIDYSPVAPNILGIKIFDDYPIRELQNYIDWTPFLNAWGLKGKYPEILTRGKMGMEAFRVITEAKDILHAIIEEKKLSPKGIFGLFPANSVEDDIVVYNNLNQKKEIATFHMLRQQATRNITEPSWSLSDYIAPANMGINDYIGLFAVTSGHETDAYVKKYKKDNDVYNSLMIRLVADRITEAFAERLHERIRKEFWGYRPTEILSNEELIDEKYVGTRPAPGYPACPDHSLKRTIFDVLQVEANIGIHLTPDYVMQPVSSITGFYISHPESKYFRLGKITREQVADYAQRKKIHYSLAEKQMLPFINYKSDITARKRKNQDN